MRLAYDDDHDDDTDEEDVEHDDNLRKNLQKIPKLMNLGGISMNQFNKIIGKPIRSMPEIFPE